MDIEMPEVNKKYLMIAVAAIIVAALALLYVPASLSAKTVTAYFSPAGRVSPGQSVNLVIEVTNTLDKDVSSCALTVNAINQGLAVGNITQPSGTIGKGENRKMTVQVVTADSLLDGTYSIEVAANLDGTPYSTRVMLEVKR